MAGLEYELAPQVKQLSSPSNRKSCVKEVSNEALLEFDTRAEHQPKLFVDTDSRFEQCTLGIMTMVSMRTRQRYNHVMQPEKNNEYSKEMVKHSVQYPWAKSKRRWNVGDNTEVLLSVIGGWRTVRVSI